ncbi:MAG: dipicolinate synthase subunit B [Clostridia bacterium]|nr:dipicolinate synthase subunit B [Clostridia bacterium]
MELNGIRLGYAFTGSFCTLSRSFDIMQQIADLGASIQPIMSETVYNTDTRFGSADEFIKRAEKISGKKVLHTISETEIIGPKKLLDLLVVAPCTSNTAGKLANGINDTAVTMAVKATIRSYKPIVIAISTNDGLSASAKNIGMLLNYKNYFFVPFEQDE